MKTKTKTNIDKMVVRIIAAIGCGFIHEEYYAVGVFLVVVSIVTAIENLKN